MQQVLKQSTAATTIVGPILDSSGAVYTGAVIGDLNITKNGTTAAMAAAATLTHDHNGHYILVMTTGNTDTLGRLDITCNKSTYAMPPKCFEVLQATVFDALVTNATTAAGGLGDVQRINGVAATSVTTINANIGMTQPVNFTGTGASALVKSDMVDVAGAAVSTSTAQLGVNVVNFGGSAGTFASGRPEVNTTHIAGSAVSTSSAQIGVNVVNAGGTAWASGSLTSGVFASGAITAAAIAADAIGASELAADAVTEIRSLASGTSDSGTTTTMVDGARTEADTDYWKGCIIVFTSGNIAGQARLITAFTPGTDTITFAPATTQAVATQTYEIWPAGRVDVELWDGSAVNALVSGRVDASVGAVANDAITAASIATGAIDADAIADGAIDAGAFAAGAITASAIAADAIGASELAADAVAEIADAVWDEAQSGHTTAGTFGRFLDAQVANVETDTQDIQSRLPAALGANGNIKADVRDYNGTAGTFSAGRPEVNATHWGGTAVASANVRANLTQILGTAPTEGGAGRLAGAFTTLFDVASPVLTAASVNQTGDSFDRIGATGSGLTSLAPASTALTTATWTNTRAGYLDNLSGGAVALASGVAVTSIGAGVITATAIADGAIDRATFAADTGLQTIRSGTAQGGSAGGITLDASASAVDDFYNGAWLYLTGGTGAGQVTQVFDYVGSTKVVTTWGTWRTSPDNTTTFAILPAPRQLVDADLIYLFSAQLSSDIANNFNTLFANNSLSSTLILDEIAKDTEVATATQVWANPSRTLTAATNITSTGGTTVPQTGDAYARLGAPAGASVSADIAAVKTDTGNLVSRITSTLFSGITYLSKWLGTLAGKTADAGTLAEIQATTAGAGYTNTTDSLEALRDRGDAAWTTGTGTSTLTQADVRTAVGLASANLDTQLAAKQATFTSATGVTFPTNFGSLSIDSNGRAKIQSGVPINTALAGFGFVMVDSSDHITGKTGLTVTATRSIDGGAFAACANSPTEVSNGVYKIDLAAADLNGTTIVLKFTATGADTRLIEVLTTP